MNTNSFFVSLMLIAAGLSPAVVAREWTDSTGRYTLEANLVAFNERMVILQRADHELGAIPLEKLSDSDREYLKSLPADAPARKSDDDLQAWTLRDGTKVVGRIVDYADRDVTLQRRRGRIYVNDRVLDNLPEFYQQLLPIVVAHFENLQRSDRRALESWMVRQRGQARTFHVEGVVLESENGDEFLLPFFVFSDEDQKALKPGWHEWQMFHNNDDWGAQEDAAFLLQSLAAARHRDAQVQREIAMMRLNLQAVQTGLTSLWEVTLHPASGQHGRSQWVVVPGRDSRQATSNALQQFPGYVAGPVRRVAGG